MKEVIHKKFDKEIIKQLPLTYRYLRKADKAYYYQLVESKFHNDKNYLSSNYYKPISKCIHYEKTKKLNI